MFPNASFTHFQLLIGEQTTGLFFLSKSSEKSVELHKKTNLLKSLLNKCPKFAPEGVNKGWNWF